MFKNTIKLFFVALISGISSSAIADNAGPAVSTGEIAGSIDNLIAGYGSNWRKHYLFVQTPFNEKFKVLAEAQTTGKITPNNSTLYNFKAKDAKDLELFIIPPKINNKDNYKEEDFKALQPVEQAIFFSLNSTIETKKNLMEHLIFESCLTDPLKGGVVNPNMSPDSNKIFCSPSTKSIPSYNMNSLLGPVAYTDEQREYAKRFIQYGSYSAIPLEIPTMQELESGKDSGKNYLLLLRTYITAQAAGLSNLYQMYLARKPIAGLGKAAGMDIEDASPLQVEEYAASRRLNPNIKTAVKGFDAQGKETMTSMTWRQSMEEASPAQVQREMVYLLAEMRYELYQQRLATERLTAIMSMMQLEQNRQAVSAEAMTVKSQFEQAKYDVK